MGVRGEVMDIPNDNRAYTALGERFGTVGRLGAARATLFWDSQTHMPPGGAWSRGEQLAAIDQACADLIVSPETEDLLETAAAAVDALEPVEDRKSVVEGKSVSVRVDLGGSRFIKKKQNH